MTNPVRLSVTRRRVVIGLILTLVVAGVTACGVVAYSTVQHGNAVSAVQTALDGLKGAVQENASAESGLESAINKLVTILAAWDKVNATAAGVVPAPDEALKPFIEAINELKDSVKKDLKGQLTEAGEIDSESSGELASFSTPAVSVIVNPDDSNDDLASQALLLNAAAQELDEDTESLQARLAEYNGKIAAINASVVAVLEGDGETKITAAVKEAHPSAASESLTKLDAAVAALSSVSLVTFKAYIDNLQAVKDSHVAVETQRAIDAANAANEETYTDPSTGQSQPNPNYNPGGGDTGGGSNGGGGGDTGGSGGGAGPSTPEAPVSNWRPLQLGSSPSECQGMGGGQEVTYGSTLGPPYNAINISTYEIAGYGWGVSWACDTGW